jgi:hypothetical protein
MNVFVVAGLVFYKVDLDKSCLKTEAAIETLS